MNALNDDILEEVAFLFYEKQTAQGERSGVSWLSWDEQSDNWKDYYKSNILLKIKDLNFKIVDKWIDSGKSVYTVARFIKLIYDVEEYSKLQKKRIDSISDPIMKQGVLESIKG